MLRSLHIENYILIDSLDISFPEGLVIITGQTGAGKSILLGALSLVAGAKADPAVISNGADNCVVEAVFSPEAIDGDLRSTLEESGVEWDDSELIVRRIVARSGRSRCFVNDSPVPMQLLSGLAERLIDIHSQHRSLLLTDRAFQLSMLDHFAGNEAEAAKCATGWKALQATRKELAGLEARLQGLSAERDYNDAMFEQLDSAKLRPGELEELEGEQRSLANAEQIKEALGAAMNVFDPADGNSDGLDASLREARRQLEHAARFVPAAAELAERLDSCRIELKDIADEIESCNDGINMNAARLEEVEDRMSLLYGLLKRHSCTTIDELIEVRERLSESLFDTDSIKGRIDKLAREAAALEKEHSACCQALHKARTAAAPKFAESITGSLRYLELERACFDVLVSESNPGPTGSDSVMFRFSSTGTNPTDVAKCASGGELSRIMLCLKQMMARFADMPTMIFDEIDTGVSGSVADKMGSMICSMGEDMQVFSITHLPQVAAKGRAHYVVSKSVDAEGHTSSSIHKVDGRERIMEIARLLSGASITEAAIANAESLLQGH